MTDAPDGRGWEQAVERADQVRPDDLRFVVAHDHASAAVSVRVAAPAPPPPVQLALVPAPPGPADGSASDVPGLPIEAQGMTGTVRFDGQSLTITEEEGFADAVRPVSCVTIAVASIRSITLEPATRTHRGYLQVDPTYGSAPWTSFKVRQQAPFDVLCAALERAGVARRSTDA